MLVKLYGKPTGPRGHERKYSPSERVGARKDVIEGSPDPAAISTYHVERHNLTVRMGNAALHPADQCLFQEAREPPAHALALFRALQHLPGAQELRMSPAMAAGVSDTLRDVEWIDDAHLNRRS